MFESRFKAMRERTEAMRDNRQMARDAGRNLETLSVTLFNPAEDEGELARYRDMGVARVVVMLLSEERDKILPVLDRWATLIRRTAQLILSVHSLHPLGPEKQIAQ